MSELNNLYDRIKPDEATRSRKKFGKKPSLVGRKLKRKLKRQKGKQQQHQRKQEWLQQRASEQEQERQRRRQQSASKKAKRRVGAVINEPSDAHSPSNKASPSAGQQQDAAAPLSKKIKKKHVTFEAPVEATTTKTKSKSSKQGRAGKKTNKAAKVAAPVLAADDFVFDEDDREIEYLEKKLGLRGSSKDKAWSKLNKEWAKEGLGDDMGDFLQELDDMTNEWTKAASRREGEEDSESDTDDNHGGSTDEASSNESADDDTSDDDTSDDDVAGDQSNTEDEGEDGNSGQGADLAYIPGQKTAREQGEDIYGRTHTPAVTTTVVQKYIPPARRKQMQQEAAASAAMGQDVARLTAAKATEVQKAVKGLMNRLTDSNLSGISDSFVRLYGKYPRAEMTECLGEQILAQLDDKTQLLISVVNLAAALTASLHTRLGVEVGAPLVETIVTKFLGLCEDGSSVQAKLRREAADEDNVDDFFIDHRKLNLAMLMVTLYSFGMLHYGLIYDVCDMLAEKFSEESVEMLLKILLHCGFQLRKDDPARLLSLIKAIKVRTQDRGGALSKRLEFMIEIINDIKNNRKRGSYDQMREARKHLQTYLNTLRSGGHTMSMIRATLQDIRDSDKKGRWWLTGAAWVGNIGQHDAVGAAASQETNDASKTGELAFDERLLALAKAQRMNTEVRRHIFCVIMGSNDFLDAYEKLLKLNLKKVQQREIVRVVMHCSGQSATFSPYFAFLAAQLCSGESGGPNPGGHPLDPDKDNSRHGSREAKQFRFTFQLSYWDFFKEIETCPARRVKNMALLLAFLTKKGHLGLGLLRNVDFTQLSQQHVLFFRGFFREMMKDGSKTMCKVVNDAMRGKEGDMVRDACLVFLKMHYPLDQQHLTKRERSACMQVVEYLERQSVL